MNLGLCRYPDYKNSGVSWLGAIPKDWDVGRTKRVFRLRTEKSLPGHGQELLSIYTHIGVRPRKDLEEKGNKATTTDGYWIVKKGDIIVNKLLTWMGAIGVSHYEGVTSPAYDILMPVGTNIASDYYHYLFRTATYLQQFKCRSRGIMDMRLRLYFDQFGQIPLPIPPQADQEAIVRYLNANSRIVNRFVQNRRRLIGVLNEQKQAIISQAVTRGLDPTSRFKPSGASWLGDIPERWKCVPIKRVATINPSRAEAFQLRDSIAPVVFLPMERVSTQGDVDASQRRPISEVWHGFTYFRRGDVVIAKITPCFENGKGACLANLPTEIGFGTTEFIVLRATSLISPEFLYRITCLGQFRDLGVESMTGAAGQQRVSQDFVANFPVPIPSPDEQEKIVFFIERETSRFRIAIARAEREIELIREYRTRLIADVVTGKLDVRHLAPPPDSLEICDIEDIDAEAALDDKLEGANEGDAAEEALNADD